jgi:hypothetical protein
MNLAIPIPPRRSRRRHRRRVDALRSPVLARRIRPRFEWLEDRTVLSTFLVNTTADGGPGSLRQAILDSNAAKGGTNTIDFAIPGPGVQTIAPRSPLPAITQPVLIDGFSQPGYAGTPLIALSGSSAGTGDGLTITGPNVTVRGLDIGGFSKGAGIHITGAGATGDWIYGDFLGTKPTGRQADANYVGAEIDDSASRNVIGTNGDGVNDAAERNLLSGNSLAGVWISGRGTEANVVAGNFIGTDVTGTGALGNGGAYLMDSEGNYLNGGLVISGGASGNRIGTDGLGIDDAGERNVVSGNNGAGIDIEDTETEENIVAGDFIGTDVAGAVALGNAFDGVFIAGGASSNWIGVNAHGGTAVEDEGNVISHNYQDGVQISHESNDNVVAGDKIGTDATGAVALGNAFGDGVEIDLSSSNTIGGTVAGTANVISGNGFIRNSGVELDSSSDNLVEGNFIDATGTNSAQFSVLSNEGVEIDTTDGGPSTDNTIGGASAIAGNLITANYGPGVAVTGDSVGNQITANRIFGNQGQAIDLGNDGITYNSSSPRQGPNNLQNFPSIAATADGQLQGWLGGSLPDATFRIDLFASAAYKADGSGEAQDFLGSMAVTTDASGQVVFTVPFTAPAGLPIITATATDPHGNTSEVSSLRRATLQALPPTLRAVPNQALNFSAAGDGLAIQDPDAGPLNPLWSLTLSVSAGMLTLSSTAGLTGSGDGTGSLSYSGPLSAVDAALDGLTYTPSAGPHVLSTLTLGAESYGAVSLESQFALTDGVGLVDTTADSGPGSLRQAILDANHVTGETVTIDFAIPGTGVQTIEPITPLPAITVSALIDGTTQPGFAGTPLIAFGGQSLVNSDPLTVSDGNVTIRGLAIDGVAIAATAGEDLIAVVAARVATSQLSLLDTQGHVLVQSDSASADNPDDVIDEHLASGHYSLALDGSGGLGESTWTTMLMPADAPFQPVPAGSEPIAIVAGDFNGDRHLDLAAADFNSNEVSILLGNGDGTFQPAVNYAAGVGPQAIVAGDFTGNGHLDLAVANILSNNVSVLLGNGDGTFRPQVTYPVGSNPISIVAGSFTRDGHLDLAVADQGTEEVGGTDNGGVSMLLGNGDGTFQPAVEYRAGIYPFAIVAGDFTGDGHLDLAVADHGNVVYSGTDPGGVSMLLGNGDGTFQPAHEYSAGTEPWALVKGDFNGNGRLDLAVANFGSNDVSILLGNGDGTFQLAVAYAVGSSPDAIVAGDFTGDGRLDLAVANFGSNDVSILLGNGDGTFQPQTTFTVGSGPGGIVAGDFTGDSHLDLAVTDSQGVQIVLGNGDGTFEPLSETRNNVGGSRPVSIVAGDFNGDGHLDLAVADQDSNEVSILLGNGDDTFKNPVTYAVGVDPDALVAGDFNGDGRTDLAVACQGNENTFPRGTDPGGVYVLLGNGDGTFQPAVRYAAGIDSTAIVAANFTRDGHLDLAVADTGNGGTDPGGVSVLLGNGDGTFQPAKTVAPRNTGYLVAGDFNGDGHLDLAVADQDSNGVSILLGNGDGTFQRAVQYAVAALGYPSAIVAGDFTGDGRIDLAVAGSHYYNSVTFTFGGESRCCWATATARSSPQSTTLWGKPGDLIHPIPLWRATSPATAASTWPRHLGAQCRCSWATATAPSSPPRRSRRVTAVISWRVTSPATATSTSPSPIYTPTTCRCCWATATARFQIPAGLPRLLTPRRWWPTLLATARTMSWSWMGTGTSSIARESPGSPAASSRRSRSTLASPRATSPGCRRPIKAGCSPASTPGTMRSPSTRTGMVNSSG